MEKLKSGKKVVRYLEQLVKEMQQMQDGTVRKSLFQQTKEKLNYGHKLIL